MPNPHSIQLQTGKLQISVLSARFPLDTLLTFGSRLNPKRRFLFVSKVLGKYVPCTPNVMREMHLALSDKIQAQLPKGLTWVLGVAETATGLGAGVAQELKHYQQAEQGEESNPIIYSHTTRCALDSEIDFSINEAHSHAPSHLIYRLQSSLAVNAANSVVLVDDEISTGKTLAQLTNSLIERLPELKTVVWTSLVNWVSEQQRAQFRQQFPKINLVFCSLLDGTFEFSEDKGFQQALPENTATGISQALSREDLGRMGYLVGNQMQVLFNDERQVPLYPQLDKNTQYTVLGTGEFNYQPYLLALQMQQAGFDVLFQSTGRSPAIQDYGIQSKLSGFDEAHQGMFYIYNLPINRQTILCYENAEQHLSCPFKSKVPAITAILDSFK
jgi:adenine/guanine phosphoribosyltransferase-like PRPP-binding protein